MATRQRTYYIVNPAGAIHGVDEANARMRLRQVGYRMAESEEVAVYKETRVQRSDAPIARPWSPEPKPFDDPLDGEAEERLTVEATDAARELAAEHGVSLADVSGSGTDGRVLKADVERHIEAA